MDYLVNGFWAAFALLANMDDATFSAITATLVSTSYAMAASLLVLWLHRENLRRLRSGTENKISLSSKKKKKESKESK